MLTNDVFTLDYEALLNVSSTFPAFVYTTLGTYENNVNDVDNTLFYTYEPVKFTSSEQNFYFMILNLDRTDKANVTGFDGDEAELLALIGQSAYDEIHDSIMESNISNSTFISNRVIDLRAENDFMINDYFIGVDYSQKYAGFIQSETGDDSIVATYNDKQITDVDYKSFKLDMEKSDIPSQIKLVKGSKYNDFDQSYTY